MKAQILAEVKKTQTVMEAIQASPALLDAVEKLVTAIVAALRNGNKVLLAGNGGSAADAQHIAGEFVARFNYDRPGLAAFALTVDSSVMTAIGNDYGYEVVFKRQVEAVGTKGDIFWAYSTSGKSPNILVAMEEARARGLLVVGFTGARPDTPMEKLADITIAIPSLETPRIQEGHLVIGHIVCGLVESLMYPRA